MLSTSVVGNTETKDPLLGIQLMLFDIQKLRRIILRITYINFNYINRIHFNATLKWWYKLSNILQKFEEVRRRIELMLKFVKCITNCIIERTGHKRQQEFFFIISYTVYTATNFILVKQNKGLRSHKQVYNFPLLVLGAYNV